MSPGFGKKAWIQPFSDYPSWITGKRYSTTQPRGKTECSTTNTNYNTYMFLRPILLALLSALLFGAAAPAGKLLLAELDPIQLAGWLYIGAAIGVTPVVLRQRGVGSLGTIGRDNLLRLSGAILFGGVLGPIALLLGLQLASAASVSLWLNLELVATALLGHLFFREQLGPQAWIGVAGVVAASAMITFEPSAGGVGAILFVALACLCWGLDNHLTALIDGLTPAQSTFWKSITAGSFNLTLAALIGSTLVLTTHVAGAVVVGSLAYGASIALYIEAAQQLGATRAQMLFASAPFFGAALAAGVLREPIGLIQITAAGLLVVSLALLFRKHAHRHTHDRTEHEHWHRHDDGHHAHSHPGRPASQGHSHRHSHEPGMHTHEHVHDLHHRHGHHGNGDARE